MTEVTKCCCFCRTTSLDELLGPFYTLSEFNFHSNCLVFSSDIRQNPDRSKGLHGFETETIKTALYWGQTRTCTVCLKKGATVNCAGKDENSAPCKATYHLPCALQLKNTLHVYHQKFETYCFEHIPHKCHIDYEKITGINFVADCCNGIYCHEECIKNYVEIAKACSKCPNCNDDTEFKNFVKTKLEENISDEQPSFAEKPNYAFELECIAERCKCKYGRFAHHLKQRHKFHLIECNYCGANAIHRACGQLGKKTKPDWICPTCNPASDLQPEIRGKSKKRKRAPESLGQNKKTVGDKNTTSRIAQELSTIGLTGYI